MTARPQDVALLPCPFCGGRAKSKSEFVRCVECGAQMNFGDEDGLDSIISSWNRRSDATLASAQAREDELRVALTLQKAGAEHERIRMTCRIERLEEALQAMVDEKVDYMLRNNLGNPYAEHTTKQAVAALTTNAATQTGATNEAAE